MNEHGTVELCGLKHCADQIWSEGFESDLTDDDEVLYAIVDHRHHTTRVDAATSASHAPIHEHLSAIAACSSKISMNRSARHSPQLPVKPNGLKRIALICGLLAAALFGTTRLTPSPAAPDESSHPASGTGWTAGAYRTANIEDVRVGQRVVAEISDADQIVESAETEVDARTWRLLRLRADVRWPDGTLDDVHVETLQPPEWITTNGASLGNEVPIPLDLVEMGLPEELVARVVANDPCPAIASGPGRVVLTTVNHLNASVYRLTLQSADGRQETVRPTAWHKFYSLTHGGWTSAQDLEPGDELDGLDEPLTVVALERHPGTHRVYNMTVESEHVYFVSTLGALSHNNGCQHVDDPLQARSFDTGAHPKVPGTGVADTGFRPKVKGTGVRDTTKKVPNPNGRLGSPAHQAKVEEVVGDIRSRGLIPEREFTVPTVNGKKTTRSMDVIARHPVTRQVVEVHQVGRVLKSNRKIPVSRERDALRDIRLSPEFRGARRYFHEY